MKGRILVQIIFGLHFAAAKKQYNQYQSFLGCFKDDGKRDIKKYFGNVNSIEKCRAKAQIKGYRYFALQNGVECRGANSYGTPYKTYPQIPVSKCTRKSGNRIFACGDREHRNFCGGPWANSVYLTNRVTPNPMKEKKPMPLLSPWKMSFCVEASGRNGNIYMRRFPGKCQDWKFDNKKRIVSLKYRGYCFDRRTGNNNLFLGGCHNGRNQKWYFQDRAQLKTYDQSGRCLDWHTHNNNLYLHHGCHTGTNQNFWWNTGAPINIQKGVRGNRRFLSTTSNGGKVDLWTSVGIRQKWNLVKAGKGYYHIMLSFGVEGRGLRLDNSYLSVTPNGQKVDVYGKDDASGRQRWKIIKKSGYFNIMINGGVSGKRKYLSTTTSGNKVDLWIKDDGSGRQRWVIPHALISTPKPTPRPTPRPTPVPVRNLVSGGGWKIVKGVRKCTISIENGVKFPCAVSPNYPKPYSREVACEIKMKKTSYVSLHGSTEKYFDYLTLSGRQYSGKLKGRKVKVKGNAKWTADFFEGTRGWKFCKTTKPKLRVMPKKNLKKKKRSLKKKKRNLKKKKRSR